MNKGFSLIEVLVSLILISVLSTSLFLFLDGYREIRSFEKKRLEAFREAASLIEIKMDYPPSCIEEVVRSPIRSWGEMEWSSTRIKENVPLLFIRVQVLSKEHKQLLSQLERVLPCQ